MKAKRSQTLEGLQSVVIALAVIGVVLTVGFLVMSETKGQIQSSEGVNTTCQNTAGTYSSGACNGTQDTINAMQDIPGWLPIIVITIIGALLIGLVAKFGMGR